MIIQRIEPVYLETGARSAFNAVFVEEDEGKPVFWGYIKNETMEALFRFFAARAMQSEAEILRNITTLPTNGLEK